MPKQNSAILLNKYIWLIDTIYSAGHITRDEIDRRWCRSLLSEDETSIPPRTFHRWRIAIEELFQISIEYDIYPRTLRAQIKEEIAKMHKL